MPGEELIDVAAKRTPDAQLDSALAGAAGALTTAAPVTDPGEIVVTGKRIPDAELDSALSGAATALVPNMPVDTTLPGGDLADSVTEEPKKGGDTIKKVVGGLTLLDLLSGALGGGSGNAATGGAGKLNPIFSAKLPGASPAFSQQSLAPRPGGVSGPAMSDIDWYRYGYNPERSFFNYVPATQEEREAMMVAPPPRGPTQTLYGPASSAQSASVGASGNAGSLLLPALAKAAGAPGVPVASESFDIDWNKFGQSEMMQNLGTDFRSAVAQNAVRRFVPDATDAEIASYLATPEGSQFVAALQSSGTLQQKARGGALAVKKGGAPAKDSFAVKGPGTGRSDEIPALLSDGEYVIDAETVALLGDGSSEAGAKRLDDFRVSIRKHKGSNLARGKFSANAKRPEKYLSGGRT